MKYAKLINGRPQNLPIFPNGLAIMDGKIHRNPTEEEILAAGYLPIEEQPEPESKDGFIKSSKWMQTDSAIVKKWMVKRDMRPLSQTAINKMLIAEQINSLAVDDNTALRMRSYYPEWAADTAYSVGYKVQYGNQLYSVLQAHTSQADWTPDTAVTLFTVINETYDGTIDDAIPYDGNMSLEDGKYYTQGEEIYKCVRDTINPVYNALAELVGLYVELAC